MHIVILLYTIIVPCQDINKCETHACRLQGQEDAADADDYMTYVTQGLSQLKYLDKRRIIMSLKDSLS